MSARAKRWILALAAVGIAFAALPFVLPSLIPSAWLREEVQRRISAAVRRPVSIGEVSVSTAWGLKVLVRDLSVGNAEGFSKEPLLKVREFRLGVSLFPLLRKRVQVGELALHGVEIVLETDAAGKGNWEGLVDVAPGAGGQGSGVGESGLGILLAAEPTLTIAAERILLSDTKATYRDLAAGEESRLEGLSLDFAIQRIEIPGEEGLLPLLRGIDGKGRLGIATASHPAIEMKDLGFDLSAAGGKYRLEGSAASALGGTVSLGADFDATPALSQGARIGFQAFTVGGAFADRYLRSFGLSLVAGAKATLDGDVTLAAKGLAAEPLWGSAAGSGDLSVSVENLGQIAILSGAEEGFRQISGTLSQHLKPEQVEAVRKQVDRLGRKGSARIRFQITEPQVENAIAVESEGSPLFSLSGRVSKGGDGAYVLSEESFADASLKGIWREHVGDPHEIRVTPAGVDFNEGKLLNRVAKRALERQLEQQLKQKEDGAKDKAEDAVKDKIGDLFKKKKKR